MIFKSNISTLCSLRTLAIYISPRGGYLKDQSNRGTSFFGLMRRIFGKDAEITKDLGITYETLEGQKEKRTVQRKYFQKPREFFLQSV